MKAPYTEAAMLPTLKMMLEDPEAPLEVQFSALGVVCSLVNSGTCHVSCQSLVCVVTWTQRRSEARRRSASGTSAELQRLHSDVHQWTDLLTPSRLCAAGEMKEELDSVNITESLRKLTRHSSDKLASQARSILALLPETC